MSAGLHVVSAGVGPRVLLIHGSATDYTTWSIQLASPLRDRFTLVAYTRRDTGSVEQHAADAIELLGEPTIIVGSSFGAVIALEVIRRRPCRGAVLIEPPMGPTDDTPAAPAVFLAEYDRMVAAQGGPAAAEMFLRAVLGDLYDRIPEAFQERSKSKWNEIRADSQALLDYRPRYSELAAVTTPVLLVGGGRSPPLFRPTLEALQRALPHARLEFIRSAGHMLHVEARTTFAELLVEFEAGLAPIP
jgi:pimeloyl-ACP methyl ester carboxylesterase